jgi:hypothetical protein
MKEENQANQGATPPPTPGGPVSSTPVSHTAVRAALCALIPGIGAVYNRDYMKAVIHFAVFASLVVIAESVGIFGLAAFSFYVFTVIDAYRSAEAIEKRGRVYGDETGTVNMPLWGSILVLLGVLFLLDNLGAIRLRSAAQFWPLILVALGGYLIFHYFRSNAPAQPPPVRSSSLGSSLEAGRERTPGEGRQGGPEDQVVNAPSPTEPKEENA